MLKRIIGLLVLGFLTTQMTKCYYKNKTMSAEPIHENSVIMEIDTRAVEKATKLPVLIPVENAVEPE